jgi:chromate transporter
MISEHKVSPLREIAVLFLKLGVIGFGGPAAHIALMESEVVKRRHWLSHQEFLDLLGATNLIPGPNSTEMAIHIGYRRAGFAGLVLAGTCFILPAAAIVTWIAWLYVEYGTLPQLGLVLRSVKPVIIVVVLQALWSLGKTAIKTTTLAVVAVGSIILSLAGVHELLVLLVAAVGCVAVGKMRLGSSMFSVELLPLFLFFLKVGSVLFGSGYVLLAFLRADLVERWHWLTAGQLLDAVAIGQVTPGPVFTTATFIGYVLAGLPGAFVATVGIFLPAFVFVGLSGSLVPRIRQSKIAAAALDGLNAGSLALMAVVTLQLATSAVVDIPTAMIGVAAAVAIFVFKMNSAWLVAGAAIAGLIAAGLT